MIMFPRLTRPKCPPALSARKAGVCPHAFRKQGSALLLTLLIVSLLLVLVLGFTVFVRMELRSVTERQNQMIAGNNARLGMQLALADLQKAAGPDQSITATADLYTGDVDTGNATRPNNRFYTGVWKAEEFAAGDPRADNPLRRSRSVLQQWLVSGAQGKGITVPDFHARFDYQNVTDNGTGITGPVPMLGPASLGVDTDIPAQVAAFQTQFVYAGLMPINAEPGDSFAYWVSDEGTKARVNSSAPTGGADPLIDRARQTTPPYANMAAISDLKDFDSSTLTDAERGKLDSVFSLRDLQFLEPVYDREYPHHFHHFSTWSESLLTNTAKGGLRKDLSIAFEIDQDKFLASEFSKELTGDINPNSPLGGDYEVVTTHDGYTDPLKFVYNAFPERPSGEEYYQIPPSSELEDPDRKAQSPYRGPTWSLLREHYRGYHAVEDRENSPRIQASPYFPGYQGNGRWNGFTQSNPGSMFRKDRLWSSYYGMFTNDANRRKAATPMLMDKRNKNDYIPRLSKPELAPRLLRVTFYYSLSLDSGGHLRLHVDPLVFLHNPYNISIELDGYRSVFKGLALQFNFKTFDSDGNETLSAAGQDQSIFRIAREHALQATNNDLNDDVAYHLVITKDGTRTSAPMVFEPGEIKYFSVKSTTPQEAIEPGMMLAEGLSGFNGGIYYDLLNAKRNNPPADRRILLSQTTQPDGSVVSDRLDVRITHTAGSGVTPPERPTLNYVQPQTPWVHNYLLDGVNVGNATDPGAPEVAKKSQIFEGQFSNAFSLYIDDYLGGVLEGYWDGNGSLEVNDLSSGKFFIAAYDLHMKTTRDEERGLPTSILANHTPRAVVFRGDHAGGGTNTLRLAYNWQLNVTEFNGTLFTNGVDTSNSRGFWGGGLDQGTGGVSNVPLFDVPTTPLLSLGQLQHAYTQVYMFEPAYVFGNSRASPYIRRDRISDKVLHRYRGNPVDPDGNPWYWQFDTSYLLNEALADGFYFSSLFPGFTGSGGVRGEAALQAQIDGLATGTTDLLNPRYIFKLPASKTPADFQSEMDLSLYNSATETDPNHHRPHDSLAAYLRIKGGFNLNSTSVEAWLAFLSGLNGSTLQRMQTGSDGRIRGDITNDALPADETPFPRLTLHGNDSNLDAATNNNFNAWSGYRTLDRDELTTLATAIVDEIRLRAQQPHAPSGGGEKTGPMPSVGRYLNRELISTASDSGDLGLKGLLQAAIDKSNMNAILDNIGEDPAAADILDNSVLDDETDFYNSLPSDPDIPYDRTFAPFREPSHFTDSSTASIPQSVTQADLFTQIAPFANVRSDTFRIRGYGIRQDATSGKVAESYCEVIVQRTADYVDANANTPEDHDTDSVQGLSPVNKAFGRRFEIVSFRWLSPDEI